MTYFEKDILNLSEEEIGMLFERIIFNIASKIVCENLINEIKWN